MKKKIFLLSDARNPHTIKWVKSLSRAGYQIFVFSIHSFNPAVYADTDNVQLFNAGFRDEFSLDANLKKLTYLKILGKLKSKIKEFKPDVLHAHYASSYGLLGALSNFHPYFISVWGTDVFEFPRKSILHRTVLKFNLSRADKIFSTSAAMAAEVQKYSSKKAEVIPFGVDLTLFAPIPEMNSVSSITIGTVKSLEDKYGIHILLEAFAQVKQRLSDVNLKLLIVGKGSREAAYKEQAKSLGISDLTEFTGFIPATEVPKYQNKLDIAVFPSICEESFGVSVIEAAACAKPVIVTDRGGFPEVVNHGEIGLIVPHNDVQALADAIIKLISNESLRKDLGDKGRKRVADFYDWRKNLETMTNFYESTIP